MATSAGAAIAPRPIAAKRLVSKKPERARERLVRAKALEKSPCGDLNAAVARAEQEERKVGRNHCRPHAGEGEAGARNQAADRKAGCEVASIEEYRKAGAGNHGADSPAGVDPADIALTDAEEVEGHDHDHHVRRTLDEHQEGERDAGEPQLRVAHERPEAHGGLMEKTAPFALLLVGGPLILRQSREDQCRHQAGGGSGGEGGLGTRYGQQYAGHE